jgi:hypothetical protein
MTEQMSRYDIILGNHIFLFFCFCDDYYSEKEQNITNFGFTHIIKQLMTLDFS